MRKPTILMVYGHQRNAIQAANREHNLKKDVINKFNGVDLIVEYHDHKIKFSSVEDLQSAWKHAGAVYSNIFFDESFYLLAEDVQRVQQYLVARIRYIPND